MTRAAMGDTGSGVQLATRICIKTRLSRAAIQRCERLDIYIKVAFATVHLCRRSTEVKQKLSHQNVPAPSDHHILDQLHIKEGLYEAAHMMTRGGLAKASL